MVEPQSEPGVDVVVFGASGDLASRKIIPALGRLASRWQVRLIGAGRSDLTRRQFQDVVASSAGDGALASAADWTRLDYGADESYGGLRDAIAVDRRPVVFYLATPPSVFPLILNALNESGLVRRGDPNRVVVEKPFGHDLASAVALNRQLSQLFDESQIYRIDHYLGKDTVQNVVAFRFSNPLFESVWNRNTIGSIQITAAEEIDIVERAGYYDEVGAVRDMIQNHLLQILALIAMEAPSSMDPIDVRAAKHALLRAVEPLNPATSVAGQYDGYLAAKGVPAASRRETYAAAKVSIENWRWQEVPIFVRTGKALLRQATEVTIRLKDAPHLELAGQALESIPTLIAFRFQPDEGIVLRIGAKVPGPDFEMVPADLRFDYRDVAKEPLPDAYENVLGEILEGGQSGFPGPDEIERSWEIVDPLLSAWESRGRPHVYARGSWGPAAADELIAAQGGGRWIDSARDLSRLGSG
jgi:glucose-6-phosphate 1-dehydrogenase